MPKEIGQGMGAGANRSQQGAQALGQDVGAVLVGVRGPGWRTLRPRSGPPCPSALSACPGRLAHAGAARRRRPRGRAVSLIRLKSSRSPTITLRLLPVRRARSSSTSKISSKPRGLQQAGQRVAVADAGTGHALDAAAQQRNEQPARQQRGDRRDPGGHRRPIQRLHGEDGDGTRGKQGGCGSQHTSAREQIEQAKLLSERRLDARPAGRGRASLYDVVGCESVCGDWPL